MLSTAIPYCGRYTIAIAFAILLILPVIRYCWFILKIFSGFFLVVCPLVALMEDQIMALRKINVPAYMLSQATPKDETKLAMMV